MALYKSVLDLIWFFWSKSPISSTGARSAYSTTSYSFPIDCFDDNRNLATRCSRKRQTLLPVAPPGDIDQIVLPHVRLMPNWTCRLWLRTTRSIIRMSLLRLRVSLQSIVMSASVCLSVCLSAKIYPEPHARSLPIFCPRCRRPWLGPPPAGWQNPKGKGQFSGFLPHWQCIVQHSIWTYAKTLEPSTCRLEWWLRWALGTNC